MRAPLVLLAALIAAAGCGATGTSSPRAVAASAADQGDAAVCSPRACGPQMMAPNYLCDDGGMGGPGPCERHADGGCGWAFVTCTPARR